MKLIIATIFALMVCGSALGADMHWCEKADGIGGNYPVCPDGYAQKDEGKYIAPVATEPLAVHLGMADSVAEASDYPWGRPLSRNRTTNSSGIHEQWVYSGRRYLYFTNGVLTSISD